MTLDTAGHPTTFACMNATFRPGHAGDATLIRAFVRSAYAKWVPVMGREPLPMTADYDAALQTHAFRLGFVAGELACLIETRAEPDHLWVENIAVRPDLQGQGLGRQMLDLTMADARARTLPCVRLLTNAALTSNVQFYQTYGFTLDATEAFHGGFIVRFSKPV